MRPAEASAVEVDDVYEFLRYVKEAGAEPGAEWLFRGHEDAAWDLLPKVDRPSAIRWRNDRQPPWPRAEHERWLLKEFAKRAWPFTGRMDPYSWELIAVAQHHGLATRMIDWTTNPLAALLFAVENRSKTASAVWFYKHGDKSSVDYAGPLDVPQIVTFDPPHVSPRITVQSARFTVHPDEGSQEANWPGVLMKKMIPERARPLLRFQLRNIGVSRAVLFPDLDGIAADMNRIYGYQDDEGYDSPDGREGFKELCEDLGLGASPIQHPAPPTNSPTQQEKSPEQ